MSDARPQRWIRSIFYNNPDTYPPIVNSARLLAPAGFEVALTCRENGEAWNVAYPPGINLQRLGAPGDKSWKEYLKFIVSALRLEREARRKGTGADLFVGHDMHGLLPARLLAALYRKPLIYHCHDYATHEDARKITARGVRWVRAFEQRAARTADIVVAPDAERGRVMQRELRLTREPVIVANAPLHRPPHDGRVLRETLAEQGFTGGRIVFRQGKISRGHAIEATLRSMLRWSDPEAVFVLMGPGEQAYLDGLFRLARELGVERKFAILPPVGYDRVSEFTAGADIGHTLYEPIHSNNTFVATASNKLMEYMASGLPLLVSDTRALRALVEGYGCGVTADEASPESIAAAVNRLLSAPAQAARMGRAASEAFEKVFCYEKQFAPLLERISSLLHFSMVNTQTGAKIGG